MQSAPQLPQQQQQQPQQQAGWAACTLGSGVSADDVQLDVEVSSLSAASVAQTPPAGSSMAAADASAACLAAQHRLEAAELAAKLKLFQHSALDILQLLQHPASCPMDDASTGEFDRLMTPTRHTAAGELQQVQTSQQQPAASTCSSNSSSMPAVPLQQRVWQEVLQIVHELNAALGAKSPVHCGK
jgi:hypothetical protein